MNHFDFYVGVSAGSAAAASNRQWSDAGRDSSCQPRQVSDPTISSAETFSSPRCGEGFKSIPRAVQQFGQLVQLYVRNRRDMGLIDLLETAQQSLPGGFYTLRIHLPDTWKRPSLQRPKQHLQRSAAIHSTFRLLIWTADRASFR